MTDLERRQRLILGGIFFSPCDAVSVRTLRHELENTHNESLSLDALRAQLLRLSDVGAVDLRDDLVRLTEVGNDAYRGRIKLPGWV